ncbi:FUSC family protein, partial [Paraburkholderia sp.]|uniref:FUSC family protein n=1 Tax=Paraburkholderia sp. TaxID=1926495 RepID=UPI002D3EE491
VDGSSVRDDIGPLRQAVSSTLAILVAADLAASEPSGRLPASFAAPIAGTLDNMARMLEAGGYPVDIELKLPNVAELTPLARVVVEDLHDVITRFAVVEAQTEGEGQIKTGAQAEARTQAQVETRSALPPASKRSGFFLPDAFKNPDHVRYALKTTVAAMFCYLLYSQINWPGIHTCFITVYMVSLGTTAETVEKMTLRIAGCLVGAVLGTAAIIFVTPVLTSVVGLMALVLVGAWLSAWVAFGSPRIAYAGFQIALVFFMCVLQGAAPGYDLTLARDRTIGILIGNVVVYLVFTRVWPVTVAARIDTGIAALRQQWERLAALPDAVTRRAQAASAMAQCGALEQDLALMHYEPSWVRPDAQWIAERRSALAKLDALEGPMFLLAERRPRDAAIDGWLKRAMGELPLTSAETGAGVAQAARDSVLRAAQDQALPTGPDQTLPAAQDPPLPFAPDAALPVVPGPALPVAPDAALPVTPNATSPGSASPVKPNATSRDAASDDDIRTTLLNLGNTRLTQIEHAASNDAAKELTTHAPA